MGTTKAYTCVDCGAESLVDVGDGMTFFSLRCEDCGLSHWVSYEDIPSGVKVWEDIEDLTPNCRCGGHFRREAPLRCGECHSTNLRQSQIVMCYD